MSVAEVDFRPAQTTTSRPAPGRIMALPMMSNTIALTTTRRSYGCGQQMFRSEKQTVAAAATELEMMKLRESSSSSSSSSTSPSKHHDHHHHQRFPPACLQILRLLPGNQKCMDCEQHQPEWASISHGTLLCISCAGRHRALGVNTSKVRSVTMDTWQHADVVAMLEGGNDQLASFYTRHHLCRESYGEYRDSSNLLSPSTSFSSCGSGGSYEDDGGSEDDDITIKRYRTRAGLFYRRNLRLHVQRVCSLGVYKGREAYRV